jgi:ubiquitin-activating enzyme E1
MQLDKELYDRQIRTFGIDAVSQLNTSSVCIIGLDNGLGTEIAKNLALCGTKNIYLYDNEQINSHDIINGIYYQNENIGEIRSDILSKKISDLNPSINVFNTINYNCQVIISINKSINEMIEINNKARENNKKFIGLLSDKLSGCIFVDAGISHIINQINSEVYEPVQISNVEFDKDKMVITCLTGHDYQSGDLVKLSNLHGLYTDIIENVIFEIKVINKFKFLIYNDNLNIEIINGTVNYVNRQIEINHDCLANKLENNDIIINNYINKIDNYKDFLQPVISIMGSIVASEAIKLITHKYLPINQWFSWCETDINYEQVLSINEQLITSNWLIVGSGAIGCELLKNLAFLNIKNIIITDPDTIDKSNLSRQFLFRNHHIGKLKSTIASEMITRMKPDINIKSLSDKVCNENKIFTDTILNSGLTGVFNALDNIEARKFMDEQCFNYNLPLFESGTQGTKGNTQSVIPFVTETYSASNDPSNEKSYPVCTIKSFPNEIQHTIHWAMDQFEFFNNAPSNIEKFLSGYNFDENSTEGLQALQNISKLSKIIDFKSCIFWALDMFYDNYHNQILQLLHNFPHETLTTEGKLFWSGGKKCPNPINFNIDNELHLNYIKTSAILLALSVGIETRIDINEIICEYKPKEFKIKDTTELNEINIDKNELNNIKLKPVPQIFDKDNELYIKWITYTSNLRAINYSIPIVDEYYTKGVAGKIIPAIATTTSTIAGLITIEMLKYMIYKDTEFNKIDKYKSSFLNLADLTLVSAEPIEAPEIEIANKKFNSWYKFIHDDNCLLIDFKEKYETLFNTTISIITIDSNLIYADFLDNENKLLSEYISDNNIFTLISDDDNIQLPNIIVKV